MATATTRSRAAKGPEEMDLLQAVHDGLVEMRQDVSDLKTQVAVIGTEQKNATAYVSQQIAAIEKTVQDVDTRVRSMEGQLTSITPAKVDELAKRVTELEKKDARTAGIAAALALAVSIVGQWLMKRFGG